MTLELDHLAVAGVTLDAATTHIEQSLGEPMQPGGEHAVFHTHNTLMGLADGLYLEAISINPTAPTPDRARWFDLDRFSGTPRLCNWICRCENLDAALAELPDGFGAPVALQRGDLRWRMAVPKSGVLPFDNCAPALIEWQTQDHPARMLRTAPLRLTELRISHPDATELDRLMAPVLSDRRIAYVEGAPGLGATFDWGQGSAVKLQ